MNLSKELAELKELHESGALTDAEFASAKEKILGASATDSHAELEPIEEVCEPVISETTEDEIKSNRPSFFPVFLWLCFLGGMAFAIFESWRADDIDDINISCWSFLGFCSIIGILTSKWAKAALPNFLKLFGSLILIVFPILFMGSWFSTATCIYQYQKQDRELVTKEYDELWPIQVSYLNCESGFKTVIEFPVKVGQSADSWENYAKELKDRLKGSIDNLPLEMRSEAKNFFASFDKLIVVLRGLPSSIPEAVLRGALNASLNSEWDGGYGRWELEILRARKEMAASAKAFNQSYLDYLESRGWDTSNEPRSYYHPKLRITLRRNLNYNIHSSNLSGKEPFKEVEWHLWKQHHHAFGCENLWEVIQNNDRSKYSAAAQEKFYKEVARNRNVKYDLKFE
jgi:hypothetical protein